MKMARAASAAYFITAKKAGTEDANVLDKIEVQDLFSWLKTISLQEYLPVLLQMGVEKISHLMDLEVEDVQEAGMTRPERKRFLRKQAELAFEDAIDVTNHQVMPEDAVSELGGRAASNISDPESVDTRPLSAPNSHRSQISVISAASSCMPPSDRDESGMAGFFTASPSSLQAQPRPTKTIDLAALEQRAHAICRIQRISDDLDLGFGFMASGSQLCIVTCLDVVGAREDTANIAAIFSDGEELMRCRLDADSFWFKSDEIGYCAVGAIFDRPEHTAQVPDITVSKRSCKSNENIVVCHWGEVDKQFTIHKVSSVSSRTFQFPVRGGLWAAPGTPVFFESSLMGLSIGNRADDGSVVAVRADAIMLDLKTQTQMTSNKAISSGPETGPEIKCRHDTEVLVQIPVAANARPQSASRSAGMNNAEYHLAIGPSISNYAHQQKTAVPFPSPSHNAQDSSGRKDSGGKSRRPPRPVNALPCLSLPCMLGGNGTPASADSKTSATTDFQPCSEEHLPVPTFDIATKLEMGGIPKGVALSFQDQFATGAEPLQIEADDMAVQDNSEQQPVNSCPEAVKPWSNSSEQQLDTSERTLSQNDTDEPAHIVTTECATETELLSARSHHEPQNDQLFDCADAAEAAAADSVSETAEIRRIMTKLLTAGVSEATQILGKHAGCPGVVHAIFQRLDELCNDSESNRFEAVEAGTVIQVLDCLKAYDATVDSHACALGLLSSLSFSKELQFLIVEKDGVGSILRIMKTQQASVKVQFRACRALCNIGYESGEIQLQMVGAGCIPIIVWAMERFLSSSKVQAEGCGVLCNLAANNESNFMLILEHGGLSAIVQAMSMHGSQLGVLYKGCCALCSLTMAPDSHSQAIEQGVASTVIKSMLMHPDNCELLYKGCGVLANLAQTPRFAAIIAKQGGVAAIVKGLLELTSNVKVQCKGLRALHFLCKTRETHIQMVRQGAVEATIHTMMIHRVVEEVQERACAILACAARDRASIDKIAWQQQGVEAIVLAMLAHTTNQTVIMEGSNALAMLALHEGAKEKIMQSAVLPQVEEMLVTCKMPATVHAAVKKLNSALYPLDSFLAGEAPDTRDAVRRSKVKGDQRPISATLQAVSRPPRPISATLVQRSRRPASATFASGSGAVLVKDLRRGLGKENGVDTNLVLQHQIEQLRTEAETLRHENLKMMTSTGAADSIAALRDVHGLQVDITVKRRPASAMRTKSPYASLAATGPLRPPSGKSIRVSKEGKGNKILEKTAADSQSFGQSSGQLEPLTGPAMRPGSAPVMRLELAALCKHSPQLQEPLVERDSEVLDRIHRLISTGRTNAQVIRHFSLVDFGVANDEVEACRLQHDSVQAV